MLNSHSWDVSLAISVRKGFFSIINYSQYNHLFCTAPVGEVPEMLSCLCSLQNSMLWVNIRKFVVQLCGIHTQQQLLWLCLNVQKSERQWRQWRRENLNAKWLSWHKHSVQVAEWRVTPSGERLVYRSSLVFGSISYYEFYTSPTLLAVQQISSHTNCVFYEKSMKLFA